MGKQCKSWYDLVWCSNVCYLSDPQSPSFLCLWVLPSLTQVTLVVYFFLHLPLNLLPFNKHKGSDQWLKGGPCDPPLAQEKHGWGERLYFPTTPSTFTANVAKTPDLTPSYSLGTGLRAPHCSGSGVGSLYTGPWMGQMLRTNFPLGLIKYNFSLINYLL